PFSLAAGAVGALVAAMACIWWTLRGLARVSERSLLAGELKVAQPFRAAPTAVGRPEGLRYGGRSGRRAFIAAIAFAVLGLAMMAASAAGALDRTGGFFGGGSSLLVAGLFLPPPPPHPPPPPALRTH